MLILVADDDPDIRRVVTRWLESLGHAVETVADGAELLHRANTIKPDCILSDVEMPGCDGITACILVRKELPGTRVLLMTGNPNSAVTAEQAGFSLVLHKPFELERLRDMLVR